MAKTKNKAQAKPKKRIDPYSIDQRKYFDWAAGVRARMIQTSFLKSFEQLKLDENFLFKRDFHYVLAVKGGW